MRTIQSVPLTSTELDMPLKNRAIMVQKELAVGNAAANTINCQDNNIKTIRDYLGSLMVSLTTTEDV